MAHVHEGARMASANRRCRDMVYAPFGRGEPRARVDARRTDAYRRALARGAIPDEPRWRAACEAARRLGIDVVEGRVLMDRDSGQPYLLAEVGGDIEAVVPTVGDLRAALAAIEADRDADLDGLLEAIEAARRPDDLRDEVARDIARDAVAILAGRTDGTGPAVGEGATVH